MNTTKEIRKLRKEVRALQDEVRAMRYERLDQLIAGNALLCASDIVK